MADLTSLDQTAGESDRVLPTWFNAVSARFTEVTQQLAVVQEEVQKLRSETAQAFLVSRISGLSVSYAGGTVKLPDGSISAVSPGEITLPDNQINFIYIDGAGAVQANTTRPDTKFEIARVTTNSGNISEVINYPQFRVSTEINDLDDYATTNYVDSRQWQEVAKGVKNNIYNIPATSNYYIIPFEQISGNGLSTASQFTPSVDGRYLFNPRIRVDSLSPSSPLAVKLSLFINNVEILLHQGDSAYGDLSASPISEAIALTTSDIVTMRVYLTRGVLARVREGSTLVCWKV